MTAPAAEAGQRGLIHFTPLRYPGGKAKLAHFVKALLRENRLLDGEYVEPYAGGAAVGLELLIHEYVSRIHINDINRPLYAFWRSVLNHTEELCRLIVKTPLTVAQWDRQKRVLQNASEHGSVDIGFAFFFLNRTNRSGILNGGIIGGRDQTGPWKIDARYNAKELVRRVETIARFRERIRLSRKDAVKFLAQGITSWPTDTLIYVDPPYFKKGRHLYDDYYQPGDHAQVAEFITKHIDRQQWMVSYDNVRPIRKLYEEFRHVSYHIGYSARRATIGSEVIFFSDKLKFPSFTKPMRTIRNGTANSRRKRSATMHEGLVLEVL